jgi:aspartate/glutamate racemase
VAEVTRLALIHALVHSMAPINDAIARAWPQARCMNLLDDSLSADLAASPRGLDDAMTQRFFALADYAVSTGAQGILFTCSAFGPCIDAVKRRHAGLPVLKPNEAMIDDAVALAAAQSATIGLVASFAPTLQSMPAEFPARVSLQVGLAKGALEALDRGDTARHDALVAEAAARLVGRGCRVIALAQFSLARARSAVETRCGVPVLTTPDSAVGALRARLAR